MQLSRRDLSLLLPALAAAQASAEGTALPSKTFNFDDLPVKINGKNKSGAILKGATHSGFPIDMHMTERPPGGAPHPPHHHVHEEMLLLNKGTMEVTIMGKVTTIGPGSTVYVASNEEHGWRNSGTTNALYFVIALGQQA